MRPLTASCPAGEELLTWLQARGLRAVTLAKRLGIAPDTLSRLMHGREPSLRLAVAIENETGIKPRAWLEKNP